MKKRIENMTVVELNDIIKAILDINEMYEKRISSLRNSGTEFNEKDNEIINSFNRNVKVKEKLLALAQDKLDKIYD